MIPPKPRHKPKRQLSRPTNSRPCCKRNSGRSPTAPAKPTDDRAFVGATCQAEAIAPDVLADIVCNAIEGRIDRAAYERVLKRERKVQRELARRLR